MTVRTESPWDWQCLNCLRWHDRPATCECGAPRGWARGWKSPRHEAAARASGWSEKRVHEVTP